MTQDKLSPKYSGRFKHTFNHLNCLSGKAFDTVYGLDNLIEAFQHEHSLVQASLPAMASRRMNLDYPFIKKPA